MFKARLMNWEEHIAHMVGLRNACIVLVIKPERRDYFRGVGVDANVIQGGSNMTGTDLCVNKPHCAAAVRP